MNKIKCFLVVSRFNEDFSWVEEYTDDYIIFNKGFPILDNPKVLNVPNQGKNARDIPYFAYISYNLPMPDLIGFIQAHPYDHCSKDIFKKLIYNDKFTVIDDPYILGEAPHYRVIDGLFAERNSRAPIGPVISIRTFDELMNKYFEDYDSPEWVIFGKGIQYIIEKNQLLFYPKKFWKSLTDELTHIDMMEAHYIERAMWYILTRKYKLRKEFYDN